MAALAGAAAIPARTDRATRAERMVFMIILLDFLSVVVATSVPLVVLIWRILRS